MCKGLNARSSRTPGRKRKVPSSYGCSQRGKPMEHGVVWEELEAISQAEKLGPRIRKSRDEKLGPGTT